MQTVHATPAVLDVAAGPEPSRPASATNVPPPPPVGPSVPNALDAIDEHLMTIEEVCEKYGTSVLVDEPMKSMGLTSGQVEEIRQRHGANALSPPKKPNAFLMYIKYLGRLFNVLLIVAGLLSFILYATDSSTTTNIILGIILIIVACINAAIEFYQEFKTASILQSFLNMIPASALVLRDGQTHQVPASELVLGDLVILRTGDKVPADLRLVRATELKVDNSSLTGESEPQDRNLNLGPENYLEAPSLAFNGTLVVSGDGQGIVIRMGDHTVLGQIASLTVSGEKRESQLSREIDLFVKKLAVVAILTAVIFFIFGLVRGYGISVNFSFAIGVFVSFVPEGLPSTVTALLMISAKRMATKNVLVKDLHGVETLGSITMLASDKTGTLTQNKMTVTSVWMNNAFYAYQPGLGDPGPTAPLAATPYAERPDREERLTSDTPNLDALLYVCGLCTKCRMDAEELSRPLEERTIFGDATETGLYKFAMATYDPIQLNERHKKVCEIPFSSHTKWHLTIHERPHANGHYVIYLKGAPERVFKKCTSMLVYDETLPLTDAHVHAFDAAYEKFAALGQRVLAFAQILLPGDAFPLGFTFDKGELPNFPLEGFTFIGLVSLMDPPKKGVRKAIASFRTAGIQVVMVTGDHPLTAEAIARKIGLIQGETAADVAKRLIRPIQTIQEDEYDAIIIHGDKIDAMTEDDWDRALSKREIVFARTSPKHKLMIVTRAQAKGHIVGVSGDGVNDSPALKKADLGISMNKTASDVSKEAAAMILLDDNFPSIVHGIEQGRLLFANLKKSIRYTLTHISPQIISFLVFIVLGIPLPLSSILVLCVDLLNELPPALSLAWEPPESDLMLVPPRKVLCSATGGSNLMYDLRARIHTHDSALMTRLGVVQPLPMSRINTMSSTKAPSVKSTSEPRPPSVDQKSPKSPVPPCSPKSKPTSPTPNTDALGTSSGTPVAPVAGPVGIPDPSEKLTWRQRCMAWYRRNFVRNETGEGLVDTELLLWSYFQAGIIITAGCFGAYLMALYGGDVPFGMLYDSSTTYWKSGAPSLTLTTGVVANDEDQLAILGAAQAAYYAGIIIGQCFTLFMVKHRYTYPIGRDLFYNYRSLIAIVYSLCVAAIIIYVPGIQGILETSYVGILPLLMPLAAGIFLFCYECARHYLLAKGYFGGMPQRNANLLDLVRTTTTATAPA